MTQPRRLAFLAALALGVSALPAAAQDVQAGISAWQAGDYPRAVQAWRPLAEAGNADAQFNLGQAYRLGRGVPQDLNQAEQWFERAARQRHEQAGASLGLLLFQNGRAREAMPWIQEAAMRGDPRAQYVFGTALFNGDILRRDLPRAYAMMTVAAGQGFPQAQTQLAEMERQLSPEDRSRGRELAAQMGGGAPVQVATAEPRTPPGPPPRMTPPPAPPAEHPHMTAPPAERVDHPRAGISYAPPPADGNAPPERADVRPTRMADRGPPPPVHVEAGPPPRRDDRPTPPRGRPDERVTRVVVAEHPHPRPQPVTRPPAAAPAPERTAAAGGWRVQLGAFSEPGNARRRWDMVSHRVASVGHRVFYVHAGALTRVQAGPFASRAAAEHVCASVRSAGSECILVGP